MTEINPFFVAKDHGDDFFVLDRFKFKDNFTNFKKSFSGLYKNSNIAYSYKTNYIPHICAEVNLMKGYAEVVSEMEYNLARKIGVLPKNIIYNGPAKSSNSIRTALMLGSIVNLDSFRDLKIAIEIAEKYPEHKFEVVLRCNFSINNNVSRFGFDVESDRFQKVYEDLLYKFSNLKLVGIHCHFPDRELSTFETRIKKMISLYEIIFVDHKAKYLNLGGGYYSNIPESMSRKRDLTPVSFSEYANLICKYINNSFLIKSHNPELILEPGTAIVADTLSFYTKVLDVKTVRGKRFATVSGSLYDISPNAKSKDLPLKVHSSSIKTKSDQSINIVGYTCIESDILSYDTVEPIDIGDFIQFSNVGSYSVVMKPPFIKPSSPILSISSNGSLELIKNRESFEHVFSDFIDV